MRCEFVNRKCIKCGFKSSSSADIIIRDCGYSDKDMSLISTKHGNPAFLGNHFQDATCFFVGGGPSFTKSMGIELGQRGICTFAVNNVATNLIRPTLWACGDHSKSFHSRIWLDPTIMKFAPSDQGGLSFYHTDGKPSGKMIRDLPNIFFFEKNEHFNSKTFFTEKSVSWGRAKNDKDDLGISGTRSIMLIALKLMVNLGFKNIYLLGCDFLMSNPPYSFPQFKHAGGRESNNLSYLDLNKRFEALQPQLINQGIKVINCTHNSNLTAFPSMDFYKALTLTINTFPYDIGTLGYYGGLENNNKHGW